MDTSNVNQNSRFHKWFNWHWRSKKLKIPLNHRQNRTCSPNVMHFIPAISTPINKKGISNSEFPSWRYHCWFYMKESCSSKYGRVIIIRMYQVVKISSVFFNKTKLIQNRRGFIIELSLPALSVIQRRPSSLYINQE